MNKPINLKEARELVQTYRSFTMEDLTKRWNKWMENPDNEGVELCGEVIGEMLGTGFGETDKCSLCNTMRTIGNCVGCLYQTQDFYQPYACAWLEEHETTFASVEGATNPQELYVAINERADHLEKIINRWDSDQSQ